MAIYFCFFFFRTALKMLQASKRSSVLILMKFLIKVHCMNGSHCQHQVYKQSLWSSISALGPIVKPSVHFTPIHSCLYCTISFMYADTKICECLLYKYFNWSVIYFFPPSILPFNAPSCQTIETFIFGIL